MLEALRGLFSIIKYIFAKKRRIWYNYKKILIFKPKIIWHQNKKNF